MRACISPAFKSLFQNPSKQVTYLIKPGSSELRKVTLIPGIGIGPEITASVQRVFEEIHVPVQFDIIDNFSFDDSASREKLKKNPYILLGNTPISRGSNYVENVKFYKYLDLYARVVHVASLPNVPSRHKNVDIAIIRENLEGEYSGVEHEVYPGVYESLKIVTKASSLRIAEYAFEFAFLCGRQKVTAVHKANIMKLADGLFLEACREVAEKYPMVAYEEMIIDNCSMQMVKNPWQFDVMVMPNLYGSIVTHTASGLCGGSGVTAGANIGKEFALFEQGCRSAARGIEGKGVANPSAALYASVNLLRTAGLPRFADVIEKGLLQVYTDGKVLTPDVGGKATSSQFTEELIRKISGSLKE